MAAPEPIAVIGVACRFPGAQTPDDFWAVMGRDESTVGPVPASRWNWSREAASYPPQASERRLQRGSFVEGLEAFDADFFGLSDAEALRLDPQQRLALEVAWEALESACIRPGDLAGSFTAVIMGVAHFDHAVKLLSDRPAYDGKLGLLSYECFVANRLSHALNLKGPSYAVNSACASSLHAVHVACQSLRAGEFDLAIAGGVNANLSPDEKVCSAMAGWLSSDAECRSFSEGGDGFVCGEGCGVVVLKRLEDALRDGDPVWGVLRDSVLGHNGTATSLGWPSGNAQRELLRRLLARNRLAPGDIDVLEAHGTGGAMSDRIEASAFADVLGAGRGGAAPLRVGCVKAHVGHLEAASGMAGLVKVLLCLRHDRLPRIRALSTLNKAIRPHPGIRFLAEDEPWPRRAGGRRAVVSNFSFGGANGVLLVEDAPPGTSPSEHRADAGEPACAVRLLALRARSPGGLAALRERLVEHLDGRGRELDDDELHTLNVHRGALRQRAVWVARGADALAQGLRTAPFARTADLPPAWREAERVLALHPASFGIDDEASLARLEAGAIGARLWRAWLAELGDAGAALAGAPDARRRLVAAFWLRSFDRLGVRPHAVLADDDLAPAVALVLPAMRLDALVRWIAEGVADPAVPADAPPCVRPPAAPAAWSLSPDKASLVFGALPLEALARGDAPAAGADAHAFASGPDGDLALAQVFARLYAAGADLRWEALGTGAKRPVPAAPFDRKPLWFTPDPARSPRPAHDAANAL